MRSQWLLGANLNRVVRSNVDFLIKEGVPSISIGRLMSFGRGIHVAPKTLICAVNVVKNLGIEPHAPVFIDALRVVTALSKSTWNKKIEFMKSIGWSKNDIFKAFKRHPHVISYSEAKLRNALHFYLNTMKLEPETVVVNPVLLGFSIEKHVRPRYNVLRVLEAKKLNECKIRPLFVSEKEFLKQYVNQYRTEVPGLLEMYLGSKKSKKTEA